MYSHIVHTDDFRPIPLFQDSKFWGKNVGARAHFQQWLLRPWFSKSNDRSLLKTTQDDNNKEYKV